jgi:valine dehydrogenase (NAD+)
VKWVTTVTYIFASHEQVVFCQDRQSGLRAIIAIHSTALGPSLGGTRCYNYQDEDAAVADVLRLSRTMSYKNALAGLDLGGGKAVIIGDPASIKSEPLLRAYGRFVASLGGRYITACDVGTTSEDMDMVARECRYVTGRTVANGGAGDSGVLTALGVFQGMRAAAVHAWGSDDLAGRRVGIEGAGKVGRRLVGHLVDAGAEVTLCDVSDAAVARAREEYPKIGVARDTAELAAMELDIFSPCALGGTLTDDTARALRARIICGGANNQLAHADVEKLLADRGILYAPDYVVNSGGVIQVADELAGFSFERARSRAERRFDTARSIFATAEADGILPLAAADRLAERRMSDVARLRDVWLSDSDRIGVVSRPGNQVRLYLYGSW